MKKTLLSGLAGAVLATGILLTFNSDAAAKVMDKLSRVKTIMQEQRNEIGSLQETIKELENSNTGAQADIDTLNAEITKANEFVDTLAGELDSTILEFAATGAFKGADGLNNFTIDTSKLTFDAAADFENVKLEVKNLLDDTRVKNMILTENDATTSTITAGKTYAAGVQGFNADTHYIEAKAGDVVIFTYNK